MLTPKNAELLEMLSKAVRDGAIEVVSNPPPQDLVEAFNAINYRPAKEDAISILYDINTYVGDFKPGSAICIVKNGSRDGKTLCLSKDQGVFSIIRGAKVYASRKLYSSGPIAVSKELDGLRTAMLEVAGRLKGLSETSRYCLELIPIRDEGNPNPEEVRDEYWSWVKCDMGEAFLSDELADRLQGMANVLDRCAEEAKRYAKLNNGKRTYFSPVPVDFNLFDKCAKLLKARGRSLTNLRTIASTLFEYITKIPAPPAWAERQEEAAKQRYGTHPPKKGKGMSIPV